MKWLIDLILEAIGGPPFFIDRGDPPGWDFPTGFFVVDSGWHDLDLSGIVPTEARAVLLKTVIQHAIVAKYLSIRTKGNVNIINTFSTATVVGNGIMNQDGVVPIGPDGMLEYQLTIPAWVNIFVTVKGWWL